MTDTAGGPGDDTDRRDSGDDTDRDGFDDADPNASDCDSDGGPVPAEDWERIVEHVPLVSVDLLVRDGDGVVLGKRTNEPAKGDWFVPGGTVLKGERFEDAVGRVAREELGVDVEIEARLGTYEHFYDTSEVPGVDSKHYVATAFLVDPCEEWTGVPDDDQHDGFRTVEWKREDDESLHPYVRRYLRDARDAGVVDSDYSDGGSHGGDGSHGDDGDNDG